MGMLGIKIHSFYMVKGLEAWGIGCAVHKRGFIVPKA